MVGTGDLTIEVTASTTDTFSGVISGVDGSLILNGPVASGSTETVGSGTLVLNGANTYAGVYTVEAGVLQLGDGSTTGTIAGAVDVQGGATLVFDHSDVEPAFANIIGGPGGVVVEGTGTETFTAVNSYMGSTLIEAGTLVLSGGGSIAASSEVALAAGATLDLSNASTTVQINDLQDIQTGSGTASVILGAAGSTLQVSENANTTFSGIISGAGNLAVLSTSSGSEAALTLTAAQTLTGQVNISGDLALVGSGSLAGASVVNLAASGAIFDVSELEGSTTIQSLTGVAGTTVSTGQSDFTLDIASVMATPNGTFAGVITGPGALTLNEASATQMETFSGANTYTGATTITQGVLAISGDSGSIAESSSVMIGANGTLDVSGVSSSAIVNDLAGVAGSLIHLGGSSLTVMEAMGAATSFAGVISDGGVAGGTGGSLIVEGAGTLTLTSANTYTGGTLLTGATLELGAVGAAGGTHAITFAGNGDLMIDTAALSGTAPTQSFGNAINGFDGTDVIDLGGTGFAAGGMATIHNGLLTVVENGDTVTLHLNGVGNAQGFTLTNDGHGGVFITETTYTGMHSIMTVA